MSPTLVDVIQGYNVGVLDPKRKNEVVQSQQFSHLPTHLKETLPANLGRMSQRSGSQREKLLYHDVL